MTPPAPPAPLAGDARPGLYAVPAMDPTLPAAVPVDATSGSREGQQAFGEAWLMARDSGGLQVAVPHGRGMELLDVSFADDGRLVPSWSVGVRCLRLWDALVIALAHQGRTPAEAAGLLWSWARAHGPVSISSPGGTLYGLPSPASVLYLTHATRMSTRAYDDLIGLRPAARVHDSPGQRMCADHLAVALAGIDGVFPATARTAVGLHLGRLPALPAVQPDTGSHEPRPRTLTIAGATGAGKSRLVEVASEIPPVRTDRVTDATTAMDFGRLTLDGRTVRLFGAPGLPRFETARATLLRNADGVLVLVDVANEDTTTAGMLLEQLAERGVPHVLALTDSAAPGSGCCPPAPVPVPLGLAVPDDVPILPVDVGSECSSRQVLRALARHVDALTLPHSTGKAGQHSLAPP
ncbi:50S ribosome-binding GTPase [Streptomyces sp. NBC_00838]|uniref:GTPase n=1 Tax=Streptomyces sp. NBC_00838 TaxID=2903680 RepID=UPI00386DA988|nr:50S ribosome-binding GTPase [Streptomyces sp. NBC_00838]